MFVADEEASVLSMLTSLLERFTVSTVPPGATMTVEFSSEQANFFNDLLGDMLHVYSEEAGIVVSDDRLKEMLQSALAPSKHLAELEK